jgi:ribosomal protein S1
MNDNLNKNLNIYNTPYTIKGYIKDIKKTKAIIKLKKGGEIEWPKFKLPKNCKNGSEITLALFSLNDSKNQKNFLAKQLLNELLK